MLETQTSSKPLVAIVGSARPEITGSKEGAAQQACEELGFALARAGWKIAVYSDDDVFIEAHVVRGYVGEGSAGKHAIVCYYPQGARMTFPERSQHPELFTDRVDATTDWEVSFYRSLSDMDGILILGGDSSTLIAGHIAMIRHLPIVALAAFGGAGTKLWSYIKLKPDGLESADLEAMGVWSEGSAEECVQSLVQQFERNQHHRQRESEGLNELRERANRLTQLEAKNRTRRIDILTTLSLIAAMVGLILFELQLEQTGIGYSFTLIVSLLIAGGLGASVRILGPQPCPYARWTPQVFGIVGGLFVGLLYLLPHLIGDYKLVTHGATVSPQMHIQYLSVVVVAFLAGLGFEITLSQLLSKAEASGKNIAQASL